MMRIVLIFTVIICCSCGGEKVYTPKPRMYPRIVFPEKDNVMKDIAYCAFSFQAPSYIEVMQDQYFFDDEIVHPCWFDLEIRSLNSSFHSSYYPLTSRKQLDTLVNDAFKVTSRHNVKANYIDDLVIDRPDAEVYGLLFDVDGPVASPIQFYLTDSTNHFFRTSLYFNSIVNPDSTDIILDFLREDINTIIGTWEWK